MAVCVVKHARVSSIWAFQRYGAFASRSLHQHSHLEWACGVEFGRNLLDHVFCRNCRAHARLSCLEMFHHSCPGVGRFLYTFDVYWVILSTEGTRCRGAPRHRANPRKPRNRVQNPAIPACGVCKKIHMCSSVERANARLHSKQNTTRHRTTILDDLNIHHQRHRFIGVPLIC